MTQHDRMWMIFKLFAQREAGGEFFFYSQIQWLVLPLGSNIRMWVFIKLRIPRCLYNLKVTPESHLFSRPLYSRKWPLHDQILFDAIMKTNECNMITYWGVPQFQSWHLGELRCNQGNAKLRLSSLSTLSRAQIISSSPLQSISLLRGSINQRSHMPQPGESDWPRHRCRLRALPHYSGPGLKCWSKEYWGTLEVLKMAFFILFFFFSHI